jgi:hypothetical protein
MHQRLIPSDNSRQSCKGGGVDVEPCVFHSLQSRFFVQL